MELKISPCTDGTTEVRSEGILVFTVHGPESYSLAEALVESTRNTAEMKKVLHFISGIKRRDGVPVASAVMAQRALDRIEPRRWPTWTQGRHD